MATKNVVGHLVYKVTGDSKELDTSLKKSQKSTAKFTKFMKSALGIGGAVIALRMLTRTGKDLIDVYGVQEQAAMRLVAAIRATGGDVEELMDQYTAFASEIQQVTTVGDEQTLGLIQIGESLEIARSKMQEATRGAIGLSKAFGIDMNMAMRGIALAYEGNYTQLSRYIPALRTAGDEAERQAVLQEAMANGFEIARAEAETATGAMLQMQNAIGDLKEEGGKVLATFLAPGARKLTELAKEAGVAAKKLANLHEILGGAEISGAVKLRNAMAEVTDEIERARAAYEKGVPIKGLRRPEILKYIVDLQNKLDGLDRQYKRLQTTQPEIIEQAEQLTETQQIYTDTLLLLRTELAHVGELEAALGESYDGDAARSEALRAAIKTLIDQGFTAEGQAISQLLTDYGYLLEEKEKIAEAVEESTILFDNYGRVIQQAAINVGNLSGMEMRAAGIFRNRAADELDTEEDLQEKIKVLKQDAADFAVSVWGDLRALQQQRTQYELAQLERQQAAELAAFEGTEEEKKALIEQFEREKAKLEYEGARKAWQLQLMGALADAARAVISALQMKPFIPLGLASAALAGTMSAIQIAAIRNAKPVPAFATGADFIVPPGYPNDSFPMQVESGEHVTVEPRGGVNPETPIQLTVMVGPERLYQQLFRASRNGLFLISERGVVKG